MRGWLPLLLLLVLLPACRREMRDDGRIKPLQESQFFADRMIARRPIEGTVARGQLREDSLFWKGEVDGRLALAMPAAITRQSLERGRERFDIFCSTCHGRTGGGDGMIVQRGFPAPPSFHQERLRHAPPGYFFGVMTHGYGVMYSYADRVSPEDRWAIVGYIRALQLSQDARVSDLSREAKQRLEQP